MAGRLYRMAKVVSANPKSWGIVDANEISGFKRVAKLSDLYSIAECILSSSYGDGVTDGADAVGQIWHVSETDSDYKLTNWASRKSAAGWTKLFYGGLDTTVYKVLGTNEALPTTGIKNCIYLKLIETGNSTGDNNKYAEYVYTGDIAGTYDATKWEKLGEVTANIDLSEYYKKTEVYNKNEVDTKIDENVIDTFTSVPLVAAKPGDEHEDQYKLIINLKGGGVKTTYIKPVSNTASGVMTYKQKAKLDGIAVGANNYVHPSYTSTPTKALYKINVDGFGHVSGYTDVTKSDITNLGIPGSAPTVDTVMSATSTNAVQNKVIDNAIKTHKINRDNLDGNLPGTDGTDYSILGENTENGNVSSLAESFVFHFNPMTGSSWLSINGSTVWDDTSLTALTDTELNEILK